MKKVKIHPKISVNLPSVPNFIIHKSGGKINVVPVHMFTQTEIKKIARAWRDELLRKASRLSVRGKK